MSSSNAKVGKEAASAFVAGRPFARDNTTVTVLGEQKSLILHGHTIAIATGSKVKFSFCGYPSNVTKGRLNALGDALGAKNGFHTVKGELCDNGKPIDSKEWYDFE